MAAAAHAAEATEVAAPAAPRTVGILGGMGPAAGADFVRLFVQSCTERLQALHLPVRDQGYPEHWLAQVPVPDRTAALEDRSPGAHQPGDALLQATGRLAALGARSVAIACNTAHAWHGLLQERFPQITVLHAVREVAALLRLQGVQRVGLLATQGTYRAGLYRTELQREGIDCLEPPESGRERLMQGIYEGVKAGDLELARRCFAEVARSLHAGAGAQVIVMGCTEIPLALDEADVGVALLNPARVLADALAREAYAPCAAGIR
ncbi:aspartate/glutamate racemase family protein [Acidovorax sp. NCPPB 4044]|uniref:aspartate/glutamate racemase family protein n=1 Tax=Acidovorax sp. NCPPB 4044 TaxID=2940490 RepID=UPI002302A11D|nr:amino acid racemase [Acidovorax sp. NCPPB 4044]MDA8521767.1 amino acid racemase [Acidovorax sp. NCPPB 4044]